MREIEDALAAWRDAQRRLENATDGDRDALTAEVERRRDEFQRLSADYMVEHMKALKDAETRRKSETPSTDEYHEAAREEQSIAADIWNATRKLDKDTPKH